MTLLKRVFNFGLLGGAAVLVLACSGDDESQNAPATSAVIAEAQVNLGPEAKEVTLGRGAQSVRVQFPAGALLQRRSVTVRALEPVTRSGVRPAGPVLQVATRGVMLQRSGQLAQPLPPPAPGRRYVVVHAAENATVWAQRTHARVLGPAPLDTGAGDAGAGVMEGWLLIEGDFEGSGEWAFIEVDVDVVIDVPDAGVAVEAGLTPDVGESMPDAGEVVVLDAGNVVAPDAGELGRDTAGEQRDSGVVTSLAQIVSLMPLEAPAAMPVSLTVTGTNIPQTWVVLINEQTVPTTWTSSTQVVAQLSEATTNTQGLVSVRLADPANTALQSNPLYLTITPLPGAPKILGYSPDNGLPGSTVTILGSGFNDDVLILKDGLGQTIEILAVGTSTWLRAPVQSLQFVVPENMPTGPLTVTNSYGSYRGQIFNVGQNLGLLEGAEATSSSQFNTTNWSTVSGWDNNLQTSWFAEDYDCASNPVCTSVPWFKISFPSPQTVSRIAMRGNREYSTGYDFLEGRFEVIGADEEILWGASYVLPDPDRDLDIVFAIPIPNAWAVKFTSVRDESIEPGFAEFEVFGVAP